MSLNKSSLNNFDPDYREEVVDLKKILFRLLYYWKIFIASIIVAVVVVWFYNRYTMPVYRVSSTILIEEDKQSGAPGTDKLLQGFGLRPGMQNLDNQILILSSWSLIGRTLDSLPFNVEYYTKGRINKTSLYPSAPISLSLSEQGVLPPDIEFKVKYMGGDKFIIDAEEDKIFSFHREGLFGESIGVGQGSIRIDYNNPGWFSEKERNELYFIVHTHESLQENYRKRMKVEPASRDATIVRLSLTGNNREMDMDFLNKLAEVFLNYNLDKKNKEAIRTIDFIDKQLVVISDSLRITEGALQKFRSKNMVMNLSVQGQAIIEQAMKLENEKARLVIEGNYYNYLTEYLSRDNADEVPIAPATMGITDAGLTRLVTDLTEIQGQYYSKNLGEKNPMLGQIALRLRNTREALKETLRGVKRSNDMALAENTEQVHSINQRAAALPVTERELLGIERQFKLNDVLYTFLLEKKSEAQIQKASNSPDNEIIDYARPDARPVSPRKRLNYMIALLAGLFLPIIGIMMNDFVNYRVRDEEDIQKLTDLPVAAHIPHSRLVTPTVVFEEPHSATAEAFRALRSKMQFFIKDKKSPVILVTSSMPSEGKTFTTINLASAYSLMGKKTILVGFDLRKPKVFMNFGISNDKGVSTWLIGRDSLDTVIKATDRENLFIIPAGPIPPNPSELTSSPKTAELIDLLRNRFDYIIIDSPPIGVVSDTFHLATLSDTCLLIVRQNVTLKDQLETTVKDLKMSDIKSLSLIVNDVPPNGRGYGYGAKYGYGYYNGNEVDIKN